LALLNQFKARKILYMAMINSQQFVIYYLFMEAPEIEESSHNIEIKYSIFRGRL